MGKDYLYFNIHRIKKLYCVIAAVLFCIGILGSQAMEYTINMARYDLDAGRAEACAPSVFSKEGETGGWQKKYTAVKALSGVDDFRLVSDTGSSGANACYGLRGVSVLPFVKEGGQLFFPNSRGRRIWRRQKRIRLFHVVSFIHRTDGKKKSCFA